MQLIFYVVLAAAVSGGVVVTIYYLVQIPILWVKGLMWKRLLRKDPDEAIRRLGALRSNTG